LNPHARASAPKTDVSTISPPEHKQMKRFELSTNAMARRHSTTEPHLQDLGTKLFSQRIPPLLSLPLFRFTLEFGMDLGGSNTARAPRKKWFCLGSLCADTGEDGSSCEIQPARSQPDPPGFRKVKFNRHLGSLSYTGYPASTCDLSNGFSSRGLMGSTHLEVGFLLRCFQQLSLRT
jgi:hypothetical protein